MEPKTGMSDEEKKTGGAQAGITPDSARRAEMLIYDYQRRRIETTYADFAHYSDLHAFFFGLLYPPPEQRRRFAHRNRAYARIAGSRLLKVLLAPITIRIMNQVAELGRLADSLALTLERELCVRGPLPESIDENLYFELCRKTTSIGRHEKIFDLAYEAFYFGELVIKTVKMNLEEMLRLIPRSIIRSSELIELATQTYVVFKRHINELEHFRLTLHERELEYIGRMFGVKIDKAPLIYTGEEQE